MKHFMKRLLVVVISFCVLCNASYPVHSQAEIADVDRISIKKEEKKIEYRTCGNFLYALKGENAVIRGYLGDGVTKVKVDTLEIPSEVDGYPVTEIGEYAFCDNKMVTALGEVKREMVYFDKVVIPEGVVVIRNGAFEYTKMKRVILPESLREIKSFGFYHCKKLKSINIPHHLKGINACVFACCTGLERIEIPSNCQYISSGAFSECKNLKKVILHEGLEHIYESAFYECRNFQRIEIPDSVKVVEEAAFWNTNSLSKKKYKVIMRSMDTKMDVTSFSYSYLDLYAYPGADILKYEKEDEYCKIHYMNPSLSAKKRKVKKGEETRLVLYGARKKVKWTVKNPKVVKLSYHGGKRRNITVRGKKKGTTTVTATYSGKTYQCEVRVK